MADRVDRVFIDTNELFPFTVMDVLLTRQRIGSSTRVWTDELLDEWERVIVRERRRSLDSAGAIVAAVREGFATTRLDPSIYRHLIAGDLSPDAGDRAHAAAHRGSVHVLITRNVGDFRSDRLTGAGVRIMIADNY